ncbi:MAG: efflux RND transporter periplasmic adaptor subunit [Bacteroidaceae bacterium]|nr:efflux RND transporter periplasmic adaptor subunit [Bacteroidaceae bacterium]
MVGEAADVNGRTYVGEVEAESSTAVSFTGSGTVLRVLVDEGQRVSKGQLIAEMDATQARNALANCEAQMRQANDALARMKQLHDQNSLADMKWVETQSQVAQAQAQLDMAKKAVADCRVYAPVSGVVGKKMMNAGETALPSQPVCTILNINNVKVKVSVPEKEIAQFSATTPTEIRVEALGETFAGGRIEKGVQADPVSRTYDIRIRVENPGERLLAGMVCEVKVMGGSDTVAANETPREAAVSVPITAVQRSADGSMFVWKAEEGKAHRAKVTLGRASGNRIEVANGLKKGEKVIVEGYQKLSEGSEVEGLKD